MEEKGGGRKRGGREGREAEGREREETRKRIRKERGQNVPFLSLLLPHTFQLIAEFP